MPLYLMLYLMGINDFNHVFIRHERDVYSCIMCLTNNKIQFMPLYFNDVFIGH